MGRLPGPVATVTIVLEHGHVTNHIVQFADIPADQLLAEKDALECVYNFWRATANMRVGRPGDILQVEAEKHAVESGLAELKVLTMRFRVMLDRSVLTTHQVPGGGRVDEGTADGFNQIRAAYVVVIAYLSELVQCEVRSRS